MVNKIKLDVVAWLLAFALGVFVGLIQRIDNETKKAALESYELGHRDGVSGKWDYEYVMSLKDQQ